MAKLLTWKSYGKNRRGGRWVKYVAGAVKSFGTASSKRDAVAYREAEKKYFEFKLEYEKNTPIEVNEHKITLNIANAAFLEHLEKRYKRNDLTAAAFFKYQQYLKKFVQYSGPKQLLNNISEITLEQFRDYILSSPVGNRTNRPISIPTAKDILVCTKTFLRWCWTMNILKELPRNFENFAKVQRNLITQPDPKIFSLDELSVLWAASTGRTKCFMLLALNCGYGQKDISDLHKSNFNGEHLDRVRSKSKIRASHKLWGITSQYIQAHKNKDPNSDRLFLTSNGLPLWQESISEGKLKKSDAIRNVFWRLQQKVNINGGRSFYNLRKTGASLIESIDPLVTEMFLSHSVNGMKKHYAQRNWSRLDTALVAMEKQLKPIFCEKTDCCR